MKKDNDTEPPFYGTKYFNFYGGSGTGESLSIEKKGATCVLTVTAYPCCGNPPYEVYTGRYKNPFTTDRISYRISVNEIEILNKGGSVETGSMKEGKPYRTEFED